MKGELGRSFWRQNQNTGRSGLQNLSKVTASRGNERRTCEKGADTDDSNYLLLVADNDKIHLFFPFQIFKKR